MNYKHMIKRALDFIEENLRGTVTLSDVAAAARCSPFHFHRIFADTTGWPLQSYIRKRRLTEAACALKQSDQTILQVALDHGFESQASFSKAFKRQFALSPGKYRQSLSVETLFCPPLQIIDLKNLDIKGPRMKPEFKDVKGFRVIGLGESYEPNKAQGISQLWEQFMPRTGSVTKRVGMEAFGISQCKGDRFDYVAGVKVEGDAPIPEGMMDIHVADGHYAVFTHRGPISKIADTMKYIWSTWMPASDYEYTGAPEFELYDHRFRFMAHDSEFDIYIPVRTKVAADA